MITETAEKEHVRTSISQATLEEILLYRAHELKQPITAVITATEMLMEFVGKDQPETYQKLQEIQHDYHTASFLTRRFLSKKKIKKDPEKRKAHLSAIKRLVDSVHINGEFSKLAEDEISSPVVTILKNANERAKEISLKLNQGMQKSTDVYSLYDCLSQRVMEYGKNISILFDVDKELKKTDVNADEFANIYSVLFNNARDSLNGKGKIEITAKLEGDFFKFSVKDDGKGIPKDLLLKVGQAGVTYGKENGTGFGLSSVSRILERYDGRLEISSEEGKGTEVSVYIPKSKLKVKSEVVMHLPNQKVDFYHDKDGRSHAGRVIQYFHRDSKHPYEVRAAFYEVRREGHHSIKITASAESEDGRVIPYSSEVNGINGETRRLAREDLGRFLKTLDHIDGSVEEDLTDKAN